MNMVAMVEEHPTATRAEAAQHLSGNLCRCADYNKILNVAERELRSRNGATPPRNCHGGADVADYKLIGKNYSTPDLVAKVTGRAKYAEDFRAEGMLFTKLLLSPMPHGRVRSLDTSAAMAMPGVEAISRPTTCPRSKRRASRC